MTGVQAVTDIIEILVSGLTQMAQGLGSGISALVTNVMYTTVGEGSAATTELSAFAVMVVIFAGISLAIGLSKYIVKLIGSLGARK